MQIICGVAFNGMRLPIPEDTEPFLSQIMTDCWLDDPSERPTFDELKDKLKPLLVAAEASEKQERGGAPPSG